MSDKWLESCPMRTRTLSWVADIYWKRSPDGYAWEPQPWNPLENTIELYPISGKATLHYASRIWQHSWNLLVDWEIAPDDFRRYRGKIRDVYPPVHLHTAFSLGSHQIHVDYVFLETWGPHCELSEYKVFLDGELLAKGGKHGGFGGTSRFWPLAVPMETQLLLFKFLPRKEIVIPPDAVSVWAKLDPSEIPQEIFDFRRSIGWDPITHRRMFKRCLPIRLEHGYQKDLERLIDNLEYLVLDSKGLERLASRWVNGFPRCLGFPPACILTDKMIARMDWLTAEVLKALIKSYNQLVGRDRHRVSSHPTIGQLIHRLRDILSKWF